MSKHESKLCGQCKHFATVAARVRYWTYTQDVNDAGEAVIVKDQHEENVSETRCQSPYMPYQPLAFEADEGGNCWEKGEDRGKNPEHVLEAFLP